MDCFRKGNIWIESLLSVVKCKEADTDTQSSQYLLVFSILLLRKTRTRNSVLL